MKLSIVTTLYRSVPFMTEFHRRVSVAARALIGEDFEIIFVNDGSPDDSLQVALGLQADDPHVQVVDLSRNFGHHAAIVAGLAHSRGERVLLMDCDLEEQPEWLALFADKPALAAAQRRGMEKDFSWESVIPAYESLYGLKGAAPDHG